MIYVQCGYPQNIGFGTLSCRNLQKAYWIFDNQQIAKILNRSDCSFFE